MGSINERAEYDFKFSDEPDLKEESFVKKILRKKTHHEILKNDKLSLMYIVFDNG